MSLVFQSRLAQAITCVEQKLNECLPDPTQSLMATPMRHAVLNGGKRLRAFLVIESAALFDIDVGQAVYAAASAECLHAYSLVHDDLPCMDDDDLRRGHPTVHIKWDEATAVLTGDALQTLAFQLLCHEDAAETDKIRINLIRNLAQAAGAKGMVLGQAQDIAAETSREPFTLDEITALQENKTGALIKWSATAGAILADTPTTSLADYADALGLAFQIHDDVLDVEGDSRAAGKRLRKDKAAGKATFVSVLGVEGAKKRAHVLVETAKEILQPYGAKADALQDLAEYVITRKK